VLSASIVLNRVRAKAQSARSENYMASKLDRFRLDGQVAVITGGARGIGRATAEAFVAAGARVVLADRDLDEAKKAASAMGNAEAHALDVTLEAEVDRFFDDLAARTGRIDILVNNAGASIRKATTELSKAEWDTVIAVNQTAVFLCSRAAARHMLARNSGAIVNLASIMGSSGGGLYPNISYQASKGAVVNMTRAMAIEWAKEGIRVNAVAPAWVRTGFIAPVLAKPELVSAIEGVTPMGRLVEPEEVAAAILFLASPAASMTTGHVLAIDGGYLAQ
jgi:NAD(P)-dependent dehydrogenase (short-subunit alcohol dehydrogenase family)